MLARYRRVTLLLTAASLLAYPACADSFTDALTATYQNNPGIKAERDRQRATDEEVSQALSGFRPNVSASYSRGRQRSAFGGADWNNGDSENASLTLRQPLFRSGGTLSSYNAAKQRARAGEQQLTAREQRVLMDAVTSYVDVTAAASILQISRENEATLTKQLNASRERFEVGEVTRTDVAQSEARLSIARTQVINAEGSLISAIAAFERVIGYKPEGMLDQPIQFPELPLSLQEALEQARASNPELLRAIHLAKSSEYDVWTNKSAILPRVDLVGSMVRQEGVGVIGNNKFDQDSIAVELTVPIYQAGAEYSRVREAKSVARQRQYERDDTKLNVEQAVSRAWEQLETARSTIRSREGQIQAAQVALDGVRQEQEYGARTVLDVLDAEQELFSARTALVQAQRDRVVATYNVLLTLGRMTPSYLQLPVAQYDAREHYDDTKWLPIGF